MTGLPMTFLRRLAAACRSRQPWLTIIAGPRLRRILLAAGARDGDKDGES